MRPLRFFVMNNMTYTQIAKKMVGWLVGNLLEGCMGRRDDSQEEGGMGGKQHSEKGRRGKWTRQGNWVAEGLVPATRTTLIRCTLRDKNNVNLLYPLRSQIKDKDPPVTTLSYLSPSSGAFVFISQAMAAASVMGG